MEEKTVIGFTGTQQGITFDQYSKLAELINSLYKKGAKEFHHGDCVGADEQAAKLAVYRNLKMHVHPPTNPIKRAFTELNCLRECEVHTAKSYLQRNHDIVDVCHVLIATPKGFEEELRSGTWATIRYARKSNKIIYIIFPDGTIQTENNRY